MVTNMGGTGLKTGRTDSNSAKSGDCSHDMAFTSVEPKDLFMWELQAVS
ncbi:MAG: hypothetical protein GM46_5385 [actinobacterium acAcidi]|nr:MAG: hypothetical protein GM46_5385 [actinobacterium acAcidi]